MFIKVKSYVLSIFLIFLYTYLFFNSIIFSFILSLLLCIKVKDIFLDFFNQKDKKLRRIFFREFLDFLNTNIVSGNNIIYSLKNTAVEMENIISSNNIFILKIKEILLDIENGETIENSLIKLANFIDIEEAKIFADSMKIGMEAGMNIAEIINISKNTLIESITLELEMETIINNSKKEFIIMTVLPLIIMFMLQYFMNNKLSYIDYIVRFFVFIIFLFSFYIGKRIIDMEDVK